jgi:hypothetical protein
MRLVTVVAFAAALWARDARACGGFFCNTPTPVDQTAEQIVFAEEDGKGTTYVQIRFQGRAPDFGWIVPVLQVPEKVETTDLALFTELQALTAPRFTLPRVSAGGGGCTSGCGAQLVPMADESTRGGAAPDVTQLGGGTVGPYEWVAVTSPRADDLIEWLTAKAYNVSDDAREVVQAYLDEGAKFVALKLVMPETVDVSQLAPVKFTFPAFEPCVPLRLTRVSAVRDMGVLVYVLGAARALPTRYAHVEVDHAQVRFDFSGRSTDGTTYRTLLGEAIDRAGGRAFTTEYASPVSVLLPQATGIATRRLLTSARYVTRLFGVISPEEMTEDPLFEISAPGRLPDVTNVHELSDGALEGGFAPLVALAAAAATRRRRARA